MNREHKYKFWLGHTKKMTYAHTIAEILKLGWDITEDIIPLEFTGLTDKNGVEVFERDKLINPKGEIGTVVWDEAGFYLECVRKNGDVFMIPLTKGFMQNKEVIGNEFETTAP
jgi:hypothetical protein